MKWFVRMQYHVTYETVVDIPDDGGEDDAIKLAEERRPGLAPASTDWFDSTAERMLYVEATNYEPRTMTESDWNNLAAIALKEAKDRHGRRKFPTMERWHQAMQEAEKNGLNADWLGDKLWHYGFVKKPIWEGERPPDGLCRRLLLSKSGDDVTAVGVP